MFLHPVLDDDAELRLVVHLRAHRGIADGIAGADHGRCGFEKYDGLIGDREPDFRRMVPVIEAHGDDLRRAARRQKPHRGDVHGVSSASVKDPEKSPSSSAISSPFRMPHAGLSPT